MPSLYLMFHLFSRPYKIFFFLAKPKMHKFTFRGKREWVTVQHNPVKFLSHTVCAANCLQYQRDTFPLPVSCVTCGARLPKQYKVQSVSTTPRRALSCLLLGAGKRQCGDKVCNRFAVSDTTMSFYKDGSATGPPDFVQDLKGTYKIWSSFACFLFLSESRKVLFTNIFTFQIAKLFRRLISVRENTFCT